MGSVCTACSVFDDPDERDRRRNVDRDALISYPDPTEAMSTRSSFSVIYQETNEEPVSKMSVSDRRAIFETNSNSDEGSPEPKQSIRSSKSKVSSRAAMFEQNTGSESNSMTNTASKTRNVSKPQNKKKWTVKGIDDESSNKTTTTKKAINASSTNLSPSVDNNADSEAITKSMSMQDRMKQYQSELANVEKKEKQRIQQHKESRGGYSGVQISTEQREKTRQLLEQRVETQKQTTLNGDSGVDGGGIGDIVLKSDNIDSIDDNTEAGGTVTNGTVNGAKKTTKKKKRTLKELLNEATKDDARAIVSGMNLIQNEFDHREKKDLCILNMNNSDALSRMTEEDRLKFIFLVGHCIGDSEGGQGIERATLCNMGIDDKLMVQLMKILWKRKDDLLLKELWLESNKIGDEGMNALCTLIKCNIESLTTIKLWNNKKDITTQCCNRIIEALESNDKITKFAFEWRLQHHKDRVEKLLRRNQDLARKAKLKK